MSKRNYCFTLNNYNDLEINELKEMICTYLVFGFEIGSNGTKHLQGYVEFKGSKRLDTLKKFNPRIHWEGRKGTAEQAAAYCKKDGNIFEKGEISKQGERNDINKLKEEIVGGKSVDVIAMENPIMFHEYGRTLSKIEDICLRKKYRTWMTECDWLWGKTGVGKSHKAFEGYNPDTHYLWKLNDKGWQDGYTGQEIVIMNDFRGEIAYNELLNLVDKWPFTIPRRGKEPVPFLAKKIIITSSLKPDEVYCRRMNEDSIEQLLRRIVVAEVVRG